MKCSNVYNIPDVHQTCSTATPRYYAIRVEWRLGNLGVITLFAFHYPLLLSPNVPCSSFTTLILWSFCFSSVFFVVFFLFVCLGVGWGCMTHIQVPLLCWYPGISVGSPSPSHLELRSGLYASGKRADLTPEVPWRNPQTGTTFSQHSKSQHKELRGAKLIMKVPNNNREAEQMKASND